ncbi:glycosyltransferase [Halobacillus salinus]|uniref:Glycosyltransferase n=1 Tax=Halobacillus salinus TaxID=192814 RepID=A0A4Z0GZ74_9BACI|nr:glycosyltransferase [Halobacillus salinus]TGB02494.1 glycosyltransferase [Halobacillus salinus]
MGQGGADNQIYLISKELVARGYYVKVLSLTPLGPMGEKTLSSGIEVEYIGVSNKKMTFTTIMNLKRCIKEFRPDILLTFMYHANIIGKLFGKLFGVPKLITSVRNEYFGNRLREKLEKYTASLASITTTNSLVASKSLISRKIFKENKLKVIPNGISFNYNKLNTTAINDGIFHWVAVGRLRPQKDYENLIFAAKSLVSKGEYKFNIDVIGNGDSNTLNRLVELCKVHNVDNVIRFVGPSNDVASELIKYNGFVLSSAWEGLPNVVMEAQLSQLPVVSTKVGGVEELVSSEEGGYLVKPKDPESLGEGMLKVMNKTPQQRKEMGVKGQRHLQKKYEIGCIVDKWEDLFKDVIKKG